MDAPLLHVGAILDKESFTNAAEAIVSVLRAGDEFRMDQDTICTALDSLTKIAKTEHVAITSNTFTANPRPT